MTAETWCSSRSTDRKHDKKKAAGFFRGLLFFCAGFYYSPASSQDMPVAAMMKLHMMNSIVLTGLTPIAM